MFCVKCGKELIPGAAFCTGCGQKIEKVASAPIESEPETSEAVEAPVVEEAVVEEPVVEEAVVEEPVVEETVDTPVEEPKAVEVVTPVIDEGQTKTVYTQPTQPTRPTGAVSKKNGITGMVLGSVGTTLAMIPSTALFGLICGIIGSVFSRKAYDEDGFTWGMAKAGKITSKVAIILGAVVLGLELIFGFAYCCLYGMTLCAYGLGSTGSALNDLYDLSTLFIM